MADVDVPHFDLPFQLGRDGATVVEQDSIEDVANCVVAIFLTHVGWRDEVPAFGVQDFAMRRQPIGEDDINNLISAQEPRAGIVVNERRDSSDRMIDHINVGVSIVSKGGV
jgi:uncharacterized protein CbrC (UPF0167 family)